MSTRSEVLINPTTNVEEQTWKGFSWPCFFLGIFWLLYKRLWVWALIATALCLFTGGIAWPLLFWLILPFFANNLHREALVKAGFKPLTSTMARNADIRQAAEAVAQVNCPECRELVRFDARICKHCRSPLKPSIA